MSEILRYPDKVLKIEERLKQQHLTGTGDEAKFSFVSAGFFITFESGYTLGIGHGKPEFNEGDTVRHTIEKV